MQSGTEKNKALQFCEIVAPYIINRSNVAVRTRLELVTPCVTGMYSNQLN